MKNKLVVTALLLVVGMCAFEYAANTFYTSSWNVWHDIWLDAATGETVVNSSYREIHRYLWKNEVFSWSFEIFRTENASAAFQWVIDFSSGLIQIQNGTFYLNQTVELDSYTILQGSKSVRLVFHNAIVHPFIRAMPNATRVVVSDLYCELGE